MAVTSGERVVTAATQQDFDIAVIDLSMPDIDGISVEGIFDRPENIFGILVGRGDISPDRSEAFRAFKSPETTRNLLFDLHHAHIPFRRILVERNPEIVHEGERLRLVISKP